MLTGRATGKTGHKSDQQVAPDALAKDIEDFICPTAESRPATFTSDYNAIKRIDQDNYCSQIDATAS